MNFSYFDKTIKNIESQILKHKKLATMTSSTIVIATLLIISFLFYNLSTNQNNLQKEINIKITHLDNVKEYMLMASDVAESLKNKIEPSIINYIHHQNSYLYIGISLYLLIFGVVLSLYRFHLNQIEKLEDKKLAFERILIATKLCNENEDFLEVKEALTNNAFNLSKESKNIESPIPGHYSSDLSVKLINKLIDKIDISIKK